MASSETSELSHKKITCSEQLLLIYKRYTDIVTINAELWPPRRLRNTAIFEQISTQFVLLDKQYSTATIKKYVELVQRLHPLLLPYLDKKGKEKLTLGVAKKITDLIWNPEYQYEVFPEILKMKSSEAIKSGIGNASECIICCAPTTAMEKTTCCNNFYCNACEKRHIETAINGIAFVGIKCPFCKDYMSESEVKERLVTQGRNMEGIISGGENWKAETRYGQIKHQQSFPITYACNLFDKYQVILDSILLLNRNGPTDSRSLFEGDTYYGPCSRCTPGLREYQRQGNVFGHMQICTVEKQCANGEGEEVILNDDMFVCIVCKSYEENYEDGTFKKCPHCGIKTLKPEGCNYVKCGDHRWCFVCNERLEKTHEGHNTHYYTGPGTSAYSSECRKSLHMDKPTFILHTCDCEDCKPHNGAPLCRELECMNHTSPMMWFDRRVTESFQLYCEDCNNPFQLMIKYYSQYNREPDISEFYYVEHMNIL